MKCHGRSVECLKRTERDWCEEHVGSISGAMRGSSGLDGRSVKSVYLDERM